MYTVYLVTNKVNGKQYVGFTSKTLQQRRISHHSSASYRKVKLLFHKALKKYGHDSFEWSVLWEGSCPIEAGQTETRYISEYNTLMPNGYNLTGGNDNTTLGYKFTEEQKESLKRSREGKPNPNLGNRWSDEQKRAASDRQRENHRHLTGDNSPSKRPDVREKSRQCKLGSLNPMSKTFRLTSPDGSVIIIDGGIKRRLKELGLSYPSFQKTGRAKGWTLERIEDSV